MTRKGRSKVREGGQPDAAQLKAAVEHFESLPPGPEMRPTTPEELVEMYPDPSNRHVALIRDQEAAQKQHFAEGCERTMLSRPGPEPVLIGERFISPEARFLAECGLRSEGDAVQVHLEALWVGRLAKMAELAHTTPQAYLETLLRRAWCAMPTRHR